MLKVQMVIENSESSPDTPLEYVKNKVLQKSDRFKLLDISVVQDNNLKFTSTNSDYATALRVHGEYVRHLRTNGGEVNFRKFCEQRLNSDKPNCA